MFEAEAAGLAEITQSKSLRAPRTVTYGATNEQAFLVLEYIPFGNSSNSGFIQLATGLAAMHRSTGHAYGWKMDNTIGTTPQINKYCDSWIEFWRQHRLAFQIDMAVAKKFNKSFVAQSERLLQDIDKFFVGYMPAASLLHGDLWGGNYGFALNGEPIIFDPAVYFGDRETDLAMTELFGGFPPIFYNAYNDAYPLNDGYKVRKKLYNLYHLLNHFNLFGGAYFNQAQELIQSLLSDIK